MDLIIYFIATFLLCFHTQLSWKAFSCTISLPAQSCNLLFCTFFCFHLIFNHCLLISKILQLCGLFSSWSFSFASPCFNLVFKNPNFEQIRYYFNDFDCWDYFYFWWFELRYFRKQNSFPYHLSPPQQLN
jgi:hypothetical protein